MKLQPIFNRHFREREREQRNGVEIIYKEIMDENFSEFEKNKDLQIENTLLVLNRVNEKKPIDFKTETRNNPT